MKKLFFILSLIFITSFVVNAQEVPDMPDNTVLANAEQFIDKYSAKITESVLSIVNKLEEPAQEMFKVVVRLQIVKGEVYFQHIGNYYIYQPQNGLQSKNYFY